MEVADGDTHVLESAPVRVGAVGGPRPGPGDPLRLVFLTDIFTPYMSAVFQALAAVSDLTVLFSAERGSRGADWELPDDHGFDHRVLGGPKIGRGVDQTDYHLSPRVLTALARARPDGIISAGFSFPTLYASAYSRVSGTPLVIHSDGTSESERNFGRGQLMARAVLLRVAGAAVANSEAAEQRFLELGVDASRLFRANHSTNMEPFWAIGRRRGKPRPGPLRVISVGRLIPRKGLDRLIAAMELAVAAGDDVELEIVGSGSERGPLEAQVRARGLDDRIRFHGFVDQPLLPELYERADVFAFPTLKDPFGIVVLEAAASGLAILGSKRAGATVELVRDGVMGLAVDPDDVTTMAACLTRLAADRDATFEMGQVAHAETLTRTPAAAAEGYLAAVRAARDNPGSALRPLAA
jgi:glycosyltransferase involved in cell wall biosynthesis